MKENVSNYLLKLGFAPNKMGYRYLQELICCGLSGERILPLKHNGYKFLSKKYLKSVETIEKDIQNAISIAWLKGNIDIIYEEFGETIDVDRGKPSNKQFIMTAIVKLERESA